MKEADNIKDLFNEKLGNFEAPVRPELWTNISSQIGVTSSITGGGGLSVFTKTVIGFSVAASVAVVSYFVVNSDSSNKKEETNSTSAIEVKAEKSVQVKEDAVINTVPEVDLKDKTAVTESSNPGFPSIDHQVIFIPPIPDMELDLKESGLMIKAPDVQTVEKASDNTVNSTESKASDVATDVDNTDEANESEDSGLIKEDFFIGELPNIFSPNRDGANDYLSVKSSGLTDFTIVILDQNSKTVYTSNQSDFVWDGTGLNGETVPDGNYVYYITARDSKGKFVTKNSYLRIESIR